MNKARCLRLIQNAIAALELDLSDLTVLTEGATGYYLLTPLIAALAGADRVLALTQDSSYGPAEEVKKETLTLAERWAAADRIEVLFSRMDERVGQADIVTNLGFVRPLDAPFLKRLKSTAVIPLMFETWEYRPQDLDLAECRRSGIPVLGTDENHPDLQIFQYVGHLVLKLLFELEIEIYRARVVVIGGGEFGRAAVNSLDAAGAIVSQICPAKGETLSEERHRRMLAECDAIALVEHGSRKMIVGPGGLITAGRLRSLNPGVVLVHIAGKVDQTSLETEGLTIRPGRSVPAGYMAVTTDYLGPRPLIDLHTAGLKVGETLARARLAGAGPAEAIRLALQTSPAIDFSTEQKQQFGIVEYGF